MAASRYRNFMRLCEEWPLDSTKVGRDLGVVIRDKIATTFKHGETTNINVEECDKMYTSLHRINTNFYKTKYARSGENTIGAVGLPVEMCKLAISNDGMRAVEEQDTGLFSRIKDRFSSG